MTSLNVALNIEVVGLLPLYDESISLQAVSLCFFKLFLSDIQACHSWYDYTASCLKCVPLLFLN